MIHVEQCLNGLQHYLMLFLVNCSYKLGIIMTRYGVLDTRFVLLRNVITDFNLT